MSHSTGTKKTLSAIDPKLRGQGYLKHVVGLTWIDVSGISSDKAPPRAFMISGFVMSVAGAWVWVTAGHICKDIRSMIESGRCVVSSKFVDRWGAPTGEEVGFPFPYDLKEIAHVYNEEIGVDYGLIILSDQPRMLLEAAGIVALSEEYWSDVPDDVGLFELIGFPSSETTCSISEEKILTFSASPYMAPIMHEPNPPLDVNKPHPRFYGRLIDQQSDGSPNGCPLDNIDGMSGGPIFAIREIEGGKLEYWLVAIQSGWYPDRRMITACPVLAAVAVVRKVLEDIGKLESGPM